MSTLVLDAHGEALQEAAHGALAVVRVDGIELLHDASLELCVRREALAPHALLQHPPQREVARVEVRRVRGPALEELDARLLHELHRGVGGVRGRIVLRRIAESQNQHLLQTFLCAKSKKKIENHWAGALEYSE